MNKPIKRVSPKPCIMRQFKGRARVDAGKAPSWWLSAPDEVEQFLRSQQDIEVMEISRSAGGRPILAAATGAREDLPGRTSLSLASALAASSPESFYGKGSRRRPGFLFIGAIHGTEIEGTVAAINLLNVSLTGKDLRGKPWPKLAEVSRTLRIVVIPFLNMDGRARFSQWRHFINAHPDETALVTMGRRKDGTLFNWPKCKQYCPVPIEEMEILGSFYNDAGWEIAYDIGFTQPETCALRDFLRVEMPDQAILSHTDSGSLVQPPNVFLPEQYRLRQTQIGSLVGMRCFRDGMNKNAVTTRIQPYGIPRFTDAEMVYHTCGALPLVVEFPCGYQNSPDNHDDILDIGLTVIEEILTFGLKYGFRPQIR